MQFLPLAPMPQPLRFPHLYGRVRGRTAQRSCSAAVSGGHDVSAHQPARSMPDEARGLVAPLLSESGVPYSPIRLQNGIGKSTLLSLSLMGWFSGLLPKDLQTRGTMKRKRGPIGPRKQWDRLGSAYGIRTRDLRLERAASWATRRMRLAGETRDRKSQPLYCTALFPRCQVWRCAKMAAVHALC